MEIGTINQIPLLSALENTADSSSSMQWWITGITILALLAMLTAVAYQTRIGVISRATTKEAMRQPVFLLMLLLAILILVANTFIPFFTLGDDVKMLKDVGLVTILTCGLLLAIWTSSTSIADEIEGKTAMTLLSKPINRRQFVVGKYLGILQSVLFLLIPTSLCFLFLIYFKVGYDARESARPSLAWFQWIEVNGLWVKLPILFGERLASMVQVLPGLILIFLEIAILASVSVAISTRLPMIANMVICLSVFVVGHLAPVLVQKVFEGLEPVQFTARLIAIVLPAMEIFNISASVATGTDVPPYYLGISAIYCAAYSTMAILMAFILFEDRDLS
jgi:ABC-type transport system involved in multi-copper enzyme maturation permease subunit